MPTAAGLRGLVTEAATLLAADPVVVNASRKQTASAVFPEGQTGRSFDDWFTVGQFFLLCVAPSSPFQRASPCQLGPMKRVETIERKKYRRRPPTGRITAGLSARLWRENPLNGASDPRQVPGTKQAGDLPLLAAKYAKSRSPWRPRRCRTNRLLLFSRTFSRKVDESGTVLTLLARRPRAKRSDTEDSPVGPCRRHHNRTLRGHLDVSHPAGTCHTLSRQPA